MAIESMQLTKNPRELARVIDQHVKREWNRLAYRRITWLLGLYYLIGARRFDVFDIRTGTLRYQYVDKEGHLEYQSTEFLSSINRVQGKLMSMDMWPSITRTGNALQAIRERSVGQVIADSLITKQQLDSVQEQFTHLYSLLGSCGITGHLVDHAVVGLTSDLEVVHPKELFPFPSLGQDFTQQRGMVRERLVPMTFLTELFGGKIKRNKELLDSWVVRPGEPMDQESDNLPYGGSLTYNNALGQSSGSFSMDPTHMDVARVRELWLTGPNEMCTRYVMSCGEYTIVDQELDGLEAYCPIGFGRFMNNGTFHGSGMFDLLYSICRQAEFMQEALFKNIKDLDKYGILVMPHGMANDDQMLRDVGNGLKLLPWEPDPLSEGFRPYFIEPYNTRDIPGRVSQFALDLKDRVDPHRDLAKEKGRVDSQVGLQFLDEQLNQPMNVPSVNMARAFGQAYRGMLVASSRELIKSPKALPVERVTMDLAGAVIDADDMTLSFEDNPLPNVSRLTFSVRQLHPKSSVARKQEALALVGAFQGELTLDDFMLLAVEEGLDFAVWDREWVAAYEKIQLDIVMLYGNGSAPGMVITTPEMAKPEFQLRVLNAFMSSPVMGKASVDVQDAFIQYKTTLTEYTGMVQVNPNPDDLAMVQQMEIDRLTQQSQGTPQLRLTGT